MDDRNFNLSLAGLWSNLSAPVLVFAEERALHRVAGEQPAVELRVRSGGIDALRGHGTARQTLLTAAGRPQAALRDIMQGLKGQIGPDVALGFAPDQSIGQQLVLPQQPDEILRAIVRNKVESLAPWPLAQCLWGMRATPIPGDPQHVSVDVAVVSRSLLDELSATLRQGGSEVKALTVELPDGHHVPIELGSGDVRRAARAGAIRLTRMAGAVVLLLAGLAAYWIYSTSADASRLEAETAALMTSLKPGGVPEGETPMVTAANRLHLMRRERLSSVAVLDEVSKLLPDTVYLVALTLDGDQLTIKGQGSGVPDLVQILEASPAFQSVNFAAATELDQNSNADAFSLIATLDKAPLPGAKP